MPDEKTYHYRDDTHQFGFRANPDMTDTIKNLAAERRRSYSDTIRLLLNLGLQSYEINKKAGITTTAQNQQQTAKRAAEAEAVAVRRQKRKQGKDDFVTAVTPMLFGCEPDE